MTDSGPNPHHWAKVIPLPADSDAPALARAFVKRHSADVPPALLADALIIVSELVTNAVVHGEPEIRLRVRGTPPGIGLGVQDDGAGAPHPAPANPDPSQSRGRGLRIVDALSSSWGVTLTPPGKIVWFEMHDPDTP